MTVTMHLSPMVIIIPMLAIAGPIAAYVALKDIAGDWKRARQQRLRLRYRARRGELGRPSTPSILYEEGLACQQ